MGLEAAIDEPQVVNQSAWSGARMAAHLGSFVRALEATASPERSTSSEEVADMLGRRFMDDVQAAAEATVRGDN